MALIPIEDVGSIGIIQDVPPYNLPPNAWSGGNNVRFLDNGVKKIRGYIEVMATCPFAPLYVTPYEDSLGNYYWLAFGATDIAVWDGTSWVDITRQEGTTLGVAVTALDSSVTLADSSDFPSSGSVVVGNNTTESTGINDYEVLTYSSNNTGTGVLTLSSAATKNHLIGVSVLPYDVTYTADEDYQASDTDKRWTTTNLNGLLIATNGMDPAQMWPLSSGIVSKTRPFKILRNWESTSVETSTSGKWTASDYSCQVIRSFKTFLIGLNWSRIDPEPRLVKWSTEASYGLPPFSWSSADNTLDAGEYELSDTPGSIVDGLPLGDSFLIYKNDSIYIMNYVGTPYIFSFKLLSPNIGCLTKNAVAEFEGGHFFMGNSDFYVCNGQTVTPLLPNKLRRAVFDDINAGDTVNPSWKRCFVAADYVHQEMLACYPSGNSTVPNKAVIWNWRNNTFSLRDLPDTSHINAGILEVVVGGSTWTSVVGDWDSESDSWGFSAYDAHLENLVFADQTSSAPKLYRDNNGNKNDTINMTSYIERSGYDMGDPQSIKFVSAVYPQLEVSGDNSIRVYVGHQMSTEGPITWEGPIDFNPNEQSKVSCRVSGKYFGVKFESVKNMDWKLHGLAFDVFPRGSRGSRMQV